MYRHHLEKLVRTRLDDILVDEGVLDRVKLLEIQSEQDQTGGLLSDVLVDSGGFDEWELAKIQVKAYGLPFVDAKLYGVRREVLDLLPLDYCRKRGFLPLDVFGQSIAIACWEVPSSEVLEEITAKTKHSVFLYIAVRRTVLEVLDELIKKSAARAALPKPRAPAPVRAPVVAPAPAPLPVAVPPIVPVASSAPSPARSSASLAAAPASSAAAEPSPVVAGRPAAVPAPTTSIVDDGEAALPPLSIPFISMKLNATAQDVVAPRRSIVRSARAESLTAARSATGVAAAPVIGPGVSHVPVPSVPMSPASARSTASPPAARSGPPSSSGDPARPRITRAAPVIPAALGAAAAPRSAEWESIFDIGESAVREPSAGDTPSPGSAPKPPSDSRGRS